MSHKFLYFIVIALLTASGFTACGNKSPQTKTEEPAIPVFGKADTTEVLQMANNYLELVKNHEYDKAIGMLNDIVDDSIKALSPERERNIRAQQQTFPVLSYKVSSMEFVNENKVRIIYDVEFFKKDNPKDAVQNTIKLTFAPQRINATWYLELLDI